MLNSETITKKEYINDDQDRKVSIYRMSQKEFDSMVVQIIEDETDISVKGRVDSYIDLESKGVAIDLNDEFYTEEECEQLMPFDTNQDFDNTSVFLRKLLDKLAIPYDLFDVRYINIDDDIYYNVYVEEKLG